jgi:hypothetical protein
VASKADTGAVATREFCPECGGRICLRTTKLAGVVLLTAASIDDPSLIAPSMVLYNMRHLDWDSFDPKLPTFEAMPPMASSM